MPTVPAVSTDPYAIWIPFFAAIGGALVSGIASAVLTQFLTWKLGLNRFAREKEFNRRIDWCEKTYRAIIKRQNLVSDLKEAFSANDSVKAFELLKINAQDAADLNALLTDAEIFASKKSYLTSVDLINFILNDYSERMNYFIEKYGDKRPVDSKAVKEINERLAAYSQDELAVLEVAKQSLIDDMRKVLYLGSLPRHNKNIKQSKKGGSS